MSEQPLHLHDQPGEYREWAPPEALRPMVAAFWSFHAQKPAGDNVRPHLIIPDGCIDLIFKAEQNGGGITGKSLLFAGPATRHHVVPVLGSEAFCGVRVRPGWASLLFGIHPPELRDQVEPAAHFSPSFRALEEQILGSPSTNTALLRFSEHLERAVNSEDIRSRKRDLRQRTLPVIRALTIANDKIAVQSLADQFGWSARTLQRDITEVSGLPPKMLLRVTRLQRAVNQLSASPGTTPNFSRLAFDCHYADLPHMDRDFRELTGLTPGQYWKLRFPRAMV